MKKLLGILVLSLLFSWSSFAWEKIPVPDYVNKKTKSPWNFYEDFEDKKIGKLRLKKLRINNKGMGIKPFIIEKESDGNKYLSITVEHGWNKCCGSWNNTERAEIQTSKLRSKNKEIWYGFRMRLPKNFSHIDDRLLISQFKNQFDPMKKSPLLGIKFYSKGNILEISGDTGGNPATKWNEKESLKHKVLKKYQKGTSGSWILTESKIRENKRIRMKDLWVCKNYKDEDSWVDQALHYCKNHKNLKISFGDKFDHLKIGQWNTFKIGIKNSKKKDGFIKVYLNNLLVQDYSGVTFNWSGNYTGSLVRFGLYRDSDPNGKGYPDQTIHYDDFIVVSDKKTLDKYLN